jgi:hypothetical protein
MRKLSELLGAEGNRPSPAILRAVVEADLTQARIDQGDWTMHRAILERAVADLIA